MQPGLFFGKVTNEESGLGRAKISNQQKTAPLDSILTKGCQMSVTSSSVVSIWINPLSLTSRFWQGGSIKLRTFMVESRKQELTTDTPTTFLKSKRVWLPGWSNLLYICKRAKWKHFSQPFKAGTQTLSQSAMDGQKQFWALIWLLFWGAIFDKVLLISLKGSSWPSPLLETVFLW